MKLCKKITTSLLCSSILISSLPLSTVLAKSSDTKSYNIIFNTNTDITLNEKNSNKKVIYTSDTFISKPKSYKYIMEQSKFVTRQGHGFAAEVGNNFVDKIKGTNAVIVGNDNIKNGADRKIIGRNKSTIYIQDKYCKDAKSSIDACFETVDNVKTFRYVNTDNNPMTIEVPRDQYDDAVSIMSKKIEQGLVPNITDPSEAKNLVRKGALNYKQAQNLAKAGTLESLKYDAVTGTITDTSAFGISTLLNYAICILNGKSKEDALRYSTIEGLKTGGAVWGTHVLVSQLSKTGLDAAFKPVSETMIKTLGNDFTKTLLKAAGKDVANMTAEQITREAAKILRINLASDIIITLAFSIPDAIDLFNGRISKEQFIKNFAIAGVSVIAATTGGVAGGAIGSLVVPGVGTIPGAIVGSIIAGMASGLASDRIADYIVEDDSEKMYNIISDKFSALCHDYLVTQDEADSIIKKLNSKLNEKTYKDMYQSDDRETFANNLLSPIFENEISKRKKIDDPTTDEIRLSLLNQLNGIFYLH